jgi:hypothetical protein
MPQKIVFYSRTSEAPANERAGQRIGKRYLLLDRDTKFAESFMHVLEQSGVKCRRLPPRLEIAVHSLTVTYAPFQEK